MNQTRPAGRHGWTFWGGLAAGIVLGVPLLLAGVLLAVLNTGAGQRYAVSLAGTFTKGRVQLTGLHGRFPDALRLDAVALRDSQGVWLTANGIVLDWSPLRLIGGTARVRQLLVQRVDVQRLPLTGPQPGASKKSGGGLPVAIDADHVVIAELALEAPVAGSPAQLTVNGAVHLRSLSSGTFDLLLHRVDAPGDYAVHAVLAQGLDVHVAAQEPVHGLIAAAAHLPDLGGLGLDATLAGPWNAAALQLALAAGPLRGRVAGTLDLTDRTADLVVTANAPAMTPAPGISWQSVALDTRLRGAFTRPAATGTLDIEALVAGGASIGRIAARITADTHTAGLTATLDNVLLPAPNAGLLAGGPITASASMALDDPHKPVSYRFDQVLVHGEGHAVLAPDLAATLVVSVPDLENLARPSKRDVAGNAGFTLKVLRHAATTQIDLDAAMNVTGGADAPPAARGNASFGATVTLADQDIILSRLRLDGATLHATATGARRAGQVTADWRLDATDLHQLVQNLRGNIAMTGHLDGTQQDFAASADVRGNLGTLSMAPAPLQLALRGTGLPQNPSGHVAGTATLAGSDLTLDIDAARDADRTLHVTINRADWKSARIAGSLNSPAGAPLPVGRLDIAMGSLADLRPLLGLPLTGSLQATLDLPAAGPGRVHLLASNAGVAGRAVIGRALFDADVIDPTHDPSIAGTLTATGLRAGAVGGDLRLVMKGRASALGMQLNASLMNLAGAPANVTADATLDATAHTLALALLNADWHGESLSLVAPARLTYAPAVSVDRLLLSVATPGAAPASLELSGRLSPSLALTVAGRNITPALAHPFAPDLAADGAIRFDGELAGTAAAPTGSVRLAATGLRLHTGPGRGLPPADVIATAILAGRAGQLDARLSAGPGTELALRGGIPLSATGPLSLQADGTVSLAVLDPILTAQGRRLRGTVSLAASIGGAATAPQVAGTLRLAGGEVQDYAQGIHITDITALVEATGDSIHIVEFTGRAGGGTMEASGSIGLRAPMPVNLSLTAENARPITSDLVTATLDMNLAVTGNAQTEVAARGRIHVRRADIQVPDRLPSSVAVLDVRRPGDRPVRVHPAGPGLQIPLDITLDAPQQVFVRGHGLDAELGGSLHVGGTLAAPQTSGGIELRRGDFSLAGQDLTFTSGDISFNGSTRIDPALDLIATDSNGELAATLTVGGYASAPTITLSSVPDRPQDEILAALLFHQSSTQLSPFQLAQIGVALAQISGVGGGGPDALSRLRKGLGLDRLAVGSSGTGSTTTTSVEAGRYVRPGVYVGAKQGTTGAQTQAEVQIDITRGLKLSTDVGSGDGANNIGLTYQFQY